MTDNLLKCELQIKQGRNYENLNLSFQGKERKLNQNGHKMTLPIETKPNSICDGRLQ